VEGSEQRGQFGKQAGKPALEGILGNVGKMEGLRGEVEALLAKEKKLDKKAKKAQKKIVEGEKEIQSLKKERGMKNYEAAVELARQLASVGHEITPEAVEQAETLKAILDQLVCRGLGARFHKGPEPYVGNDGFLIEEPGQEQKEALKNALLELNEAAPQKIFSILEKLDVIYLKIMEPRKISQEVENEIQKVMREGNYSCGDFQSSYDAASRIVQSRRNKPYAF
jgi:hypothetical protein